MRSAPRGPIGSTVVAAVLGAGIIAVPAAATVSTHHVPVHTMSVHHVPGAVPTVPAYPDHPNAVGMANAAAVIAAATGH
jgi:hypothetical protein